MEYNLFKNVMKVASLMVKIGCAKEEVNDFFVKRNIAVSSSQLESFITHAK